MSAEAWRHSGTDVAPRSFAWQACHFQHLGLDLRGRHGALLSVSGLIVNFFDSQPLLSHFRAEYMHPCYIARCWDL